MCTVWKEVCWEGGGVNCWAFYDISLLALCWPCLNALIPPNLGSRQPFEVPCYGSAREDHFSKSLSVLAQKSRSCHLGGKTDSCGSRHEADCSNTIALGYYTHAYLMGAYMWACFPFPRKLTPSADAYKNVISSHYSTTPHFRWVIG